MHVTMRNFSIYLENSGEDWGLSVMTNWKRFTRASIDCMVEDLEAMRPGEVRLFDPLPTMDGGWRGFQGMQLVIPDGYTITPQDDRYRVRRLPLVEHG
jgi:hypothetical protein